jgi:hypothetical protein
MRRTSSSRRAQAAQRVRLVLQILEDRNPVSDLSHLAHAALGNDTGPAPVAQSAPPRIFTSLTACAWIFRYWRSPGRPTPPRRQG